MAMATWARVIFGAASSVLAGTALAAGDVYDQFFRYTEREHKAYFSEMPGETVDPFTGTLQIVQTDLVLPGKAGLDLRIVRTYSSKIWGRADLLDMEPLLAEKERSVLGYGWTFHMGRLKNPSGSGGSGTCSGDFPIFEGADGSARVFYPTGTAGVYISKDFWRLQQNCSAVMGAAGACIVSNEGTRHEFRSANQYWYGASTVPVWPASAIVDTLHPNNRITVQYLSQSGAVSSITDTYGRAITFSYTTLDSVTKRLDDMTVNGKVYRYEYALRQSGCGTGCYSVPGSGRYFLTRVQPPAGPAYQYEYATAVPVAQNQYALSKITYPAGGTTSYAYGSSSFYTGYESVPFAVVTQRVVAGRGVTGGTWTYAYTAPGSGAAMNVTTITRPDGRQDAYTMYGLGYVAGMNPTNPTGNTWRIGLTTEIARGNRAEVETFTWGKLTSAVSSAYFSAPVYSSCGVYPIYDAGVQVPVTTQRKVTRDGATYTTDYSNFDAYGQARTVSETGTQSAGTQTRTTTWTYSPVTDTGINWVRGRPLTQQVTVGSESVNNGWTYRGAPDYARTAETLAGVTTSFAYDTDGNLSKVTNALGQDLTLSGYTTGNGIPTALNFNGAFTVTRTASWEGWVRTQRNGRGYTTAWDYDAIGRVEKVTPPGITLATSYAYATDSSNVVLTRGSYSKTTNLDGLGRITGTSDSVGVLTSVRYDSMGRAFFKSYPYDTAIGEVGDRYAFDGLDRPTTWTKGYRWASNACDVAGACNVTMSYSSNCATTTVYRASSDTATTTACSGSFGDPGERELRRVTDANGKIWQYGYNARGDLKTVTAPISKGNRTFTYFATTYFPSSEATGESGTTSFGRNAIGQMTSRTDARGVNVTYGYGDPLSRLKTITYGGGSPDNVTRSYDDESNVTGVASTNGGTYSYDYDELNRMKSQTWTFGGRTYTTSYGYNSAGCLTSITYPTGTAVTMTCDAANRVKTVSAGGAIVSAVTYHPSGQPEAMTYGNGKATSIGFDYRARTTSIASAGVLGLTFGYDGADNVKSFDNTAVANAGRTMTYDKLDRLETSVAPSQWGTTAYGYDELGNRTLKSEALTTSYAYDSSNRLASASPPGGSSTFERYANLTLTWDAAGRLSSTSDGATYLYDGRGRRVQKTDASGTTVYHYDDAGRVIAETLPDGTKVRDYLYLAGRLVAVDGCLTTSPPGCAERQWYHVDTLGTPLARTNSSGTVTARFDYRGWGEQWSASGPASADDRQYNGRVFDPGTGFHDYGARLYWPQVGRFVSADTYLGSTADPASLNRFAYVHNNPYKYTDPTGHCPSCVLAGVGFAVGGIWAGVVSYQNGARGWDLALNILQGGSAGAIIGGTLGMAGEAVVGGVALWRVSRAMQGGAPAIADDAAALSARAQEVHGALDPIAQTQRTTTVLRTRQGLDVVAGGARDLTPAQRAMLQAGEVAAKGPGEHAEITALKHAAGGGLAPQTMAVTRPICVDCKTAIEQSGGKVTSPTTAKW